MFSFLFGTSSRRQKAEVLKAIIENIHVDNYNQSLYIASMDILTDEEFEKFYTQITNSITITQSEQKKIIIQPFKLPGINSI